MKVLCLFGIILLVALGSCSSEDPITPPPPPDTTSPSVLSITPADGSTDIPVNVVVRVDFSEAIRPSTVTDQTFMIEGVDGTVASKIVSATFAPTNPLDPGTPYTGRITTEVEDEAGNRFAKDFVWTFTTSTQPVAKAGPDQDASLGRIVTLNGTGSFDPDSQPLITYDWTQVSGPQVALAGSGPTPQFSAPNSVSTLEFDLVVATATEQSVADRVVITVLEDKDNAFFVSPAGSPGNPGTRELPLSSVQTAINAANAAGQNGDVYVAAGNYSESLTLRDKVSLYGGFDQATWLRDTQNLDTVILGGTTAILGSNTSDLTLEALTISSADAGGMGESSYGVRLVSCLRVTIADCVISAGKGTAGSNSPDVTSQPPRAADGSPGNGFVGGNGGDAIFFGGRGGLGGDYPGRPLGENGHVGNGYTPGGGGLAGGPGLTAGSGGRGGAGLIGTAGRGGFGAGIINVTYLPADGATGEKGQDGSGGGGGGGGHGGIENVHFGGGGGGAGAGGTGGTGGPGGAGGGGSFGVFLANTSTANVLRCSIITSDGGKGGTGGLRGPGGLPGSGASGYLSVGGNGGKGGDGGVGGQGGSGGGGGGGPSIGVAYCLTCLVAPTSTSYQVGTGGSGGPGPGEPGDAGVEETLLRF